MHDVTNVVYTTGAIIAEREAPEANDMEVETLVAWPILGEHGLALLLVWAWAVLAGIALLPYLRLRIGLAGVPLVGVVYWSVALYSFPFAGGLDIAAAVIGVLLAISWARQWRAAAWTPIWRRWSWSTLILFVGGLPYVTTMLYHYVPFGMDGSMHTTAAALIARSGGLPVSYAPFAGDVPFPPMNIGLSALAGVAIRWGGEPAAVMLACHHLTFMLLILATYLLLRGWVGRTPAALLAVVSVWTARGSQASLQWGGFPTVMSVAVGVFAARLLWQNARSTSWQLSLATGAAIAAIPLIHGVGAGTWLYCVLPWITLATVAQARNRWTTVRGLALSALATAILLLIYRSAGKIDVQATDMEVTRDWQRSSAPLGANAWLSAFDYIRKDSGSFVVVMGWIACGILVLRRQWLPAVLLTAAWLTLATVVANSRWWVLPASFLLYPERAIYWAAPLSAAALALAWRNMPPPLSPSAWPTGLLSIGLLGVAGYYQNQFYQKIVREDFVNEDGWAALAWSKQHLQPQRDFVRTAYNSTGSFLPSLAQVGCTGAHHHHFIQRQVAESLRKRAVTHVLVDQTLAPADVPPGTVVFRNRTIVIVAINDYPLAADLAPRGASRTAK